MKNSYENHEVFLGEKNYKIFFGQNILENCNSVFKNYVFGEKIIVVYDSSLEKNHLSRLMTSLDGFNTNLIKVKSGEKSKSFYSLNILLNQILSLGVTRNTILVAFGGGVIGDLVGFAASILLRGVKYIQIPSTLLAQVDSSVGGKTAIDTPQGKNLVGAFYQPRLVLADLTTLDTLPLRQILAGYAEVIKYGLINNPDFFEWCETNGSDLINGDLGLRAHAVEKSCFIKAQVVARDEREAGLRALLNLGHTFGHAFEVEVGFGKKLLHGEAVAMGTIAAFEFSQRLGLCSGQDVVRIREHFRAVGLPIDISSVVTKKWTTDKLIHHMGKDKKTEGDNLTFILARGIGQAYIETDVPAEALRVLLSDLLLT